CSQVAQAFLSKFQLSATEMATLLSQRDGPITEDFFRALNGVKNIHKDVKVLLRTNQQTAGLEIMEQMAVLQETTYEQLRLRVSVQAMACLQDRPVLYKYTLDEFGTARRPAVVREMHSHDPLRYVGDMLAWLHQATASEKEHLEALLKQVTVQGVEENMQEVVGHITEGVCRPLKQVIIAKPGAVLLYKLSNLLKFYHHTISGIMGTSLSSLLMTIDEIHMLSKKMFFNSLSLHASCLMDKVILVFSGPTASLTQTLSLLREVLASHDLSVLPLDARQADFVLSCILDPLLQLCTISASNLDTADMATYLVNSLYMMKTTLAIFEFTDKRLEMLEFQIEAHLDTLINEQASFVLTRAGLSHIYSCVQQHTTEQGPMSNLPGMDFTSLKTAMVRPGADLQTVHRAGVTNPTNGYKEAELVLHRSPQQVQTLLS
uniref:Component of oligomeric golgi complex 6 n=1 Tax=Cyprinus carpio TaxID=7962 RepID=A0A8C2JXI4_CYPCA